MRKNATLASRGIPNTNKQPTAIRPRSGGAVVVGALRTTLPLGPLVYGSFIEIRKKQRWFTQKKSFFRSIQNILDILLTHVGLANVLYYYTKITLTEIESQIRKSFLRSITFIFQFWLLAITKICTYLKWSPRCPGVLPRPGCGRIGGVYLQI